MRRSLLLLGLSALSVVVETSANGPHPLTVDDVLRMEDVGRVALTPDSRFLLYEWIAPYQRAPNLETLEATVDRSALAKIKVIDLERPITSRPLFDQDEGGGYWLGGLSPDGAKLAFYSLIHGQVRAGVFDFASQRVTMFSFTPNYSEFIVQRPVWISSSELIYCAMPPGRQPAIVDRSGVVARINELWQTAFGGRKPSATVIRSTPSGTDEASSFREGSLIRANAITGADQKIGDGYFYNLRLSSDGRYLAGLKEGGRLQVHPDEPTSHVELINRQLVVVDLSTAASAAVPCPKCNVLQGSLRWSTDGNRLTFFARDVGDRAENAAMLRYTPVSDSLERPDTGAIQFACGQTVRRSLVHTVDFGLRTAVFGRTRAPGDVPQSSLPFRCDTSGRHDWFLVGRDAKPLNLTNALGAVSGDLVGIKDNALFVLADGHIWRVGASGDRRNLTRGVKGPLTSWSVGRERAYAHARDEIFNGTIVPTTQTVLLSSDQVITLHLDSGRYTTLKRPSRGARLLSVAEDGRGAVFREDTTSGSKLLLGRHGKASEEILTINEHLGEVADTPKVHIRYRVPSGEELSSCMLLPADWRRERPYPLVVSAYPGTQGECETSELSQFSPFNLKFVAARGYVVLFAATPKHLIRTPDGPTLGLAPLVLGPVDQAIREGYADPNRLGVFGFSQGHHSALQLITETDRFKAAVAMHGVSDFGSHYGTIPLRYRLDLNNLDVGNAGRYESASSDNWLGVKPWEDPQAYIRNSPVFHVDKIRTPVLIMHSDLDVFPLGQSEEMFSALYRLRKEATYVTYWGEGHGNLSPANIRDMWQRIWAWFDDHLDVSRDEQGSLVFDGDRVASRNGAMALKPGDFAKFDRRALKVRGDQSQQ